MSAAVQVQCEMCERPKTAGQEGWTISRNGEDFCPECTASAMAELKRMIDALPQRIALCPDPNCHAEFYYPLQEDESLLCPTPGCNQQMVVYVKCGTRDSRLGIGTRQKHKSTGRVYEVLGCDVHGRLTIWTDGRRSLRVWPDYWLGHDWEPVG